MSLMGRADENVKTGRLWEGPTRIPTGLLWARNHQWRQTPPMATSKKTSGGQARRGTGRSVIINTQCYIFLFRNCKVIVSRMWMIQKRWSMAVVCTVLGRCVFLANLILGSEHIRINMVKACWGARGSPVLATIYRPPTKCKVHTWIIKCWLYWKHKKSGFPGLSARKVETQWIAVIHAFVFEGWKIMEKNQRMWVGWWWWKAGLENCNRNHREG